MGGVCAKVGGVCEPGAGEGPNCCSALAPSSLQVKGELVGVRCEPKVLVALLPPYTCECDAPVPLRSMVPRGDSLKESDRTGVLRSEALRLGERAGDAFLLFLRLSTELCEPWREPWRELLSREEPR